MNMEQTVKATCERFQEIARYDLKHLDVVGAFGRVAKLHESEMSKKDAELKFLRAHLGRTGDCRKCEEDGDPSCPWYGEPDGCNNREARGKFLDDKLVDPLVVKDRIITEGVECFT